MSTDQIAVTRDEARRIVHWYWADPMFYDPTNEAIVARLAAFIEDEA